MPVKTTKHNLDNLKEHEVVSIQNSTNLKTNQPKHQPLERAINVELVQVWGSPSFDCRLRGIKEKEDELRRAVSGTVGKHHGR